MQPTLAGYIEFLRDIVQIPVSVLPDSSPYIQLSYDLSKEIVYEGFNCISSVLYTNGVYNLATDILINIAQDTPPSTFWTDLREKYGINAFVAGVIQSSADENTSQSLVVPEFFKELTMSNLMNMKTPWGRAYLALAQQWGSIWGLS